MPSVADVILLRARMATGPSTEDRERAGDGREGLPRLLAGHAAVVLTILGLIAYAIARAASDAFYGSISVVPEEVGVTYVSILSRAAVYLAVAGLLLALASRVPAQVGASRRSALSAAVGVSAVALGAIFALLGQEAFILFVGGGYAVLAIWTGLIGYAAYKLARIRYREPQRLYREMAEWGGVIAVATLVLMFSIGRDLSIRAREGIPFGPNTFQFLSVRADVVCLRGKSERVPREREGPYIYLGRAEGTMVLFDPNADHFSVVRLPTSDFITEWATPVRSPKRFFFQRSGKWACPPAPSFGD